MSEPILTGPVTQIAPVAPPRGAPPKDPVKLAAYLEQKRLATASIAQFNANVSPVHYAQESPAQVIARVSPRFDILNKVSIGCAKGYIPSIIISGAGGIGKTYNVMQIVENERQERLAQIELMPEAGINELIVEVVGGYMTPLRLYMALYRNRFENSLLIFDDCDSVLSVEQSVNLLKRALDTTAVRMISYDSGAQDLKDADIPLTHQFQGTIMFISNLNFHEIVKHGKSKLVPHLQALITRTDVLDLNLHTNRDKVIWINHIIESNNMLVNMGLSGEQQAAALKYMNDNQDSFLSLSFRTLVRIAGYMKTDFDNWQQWANVLMLTK